MSKQITCNDRQLEALIATENGFLDAVGMPTTPDEAKAVAKSLKFIETCESGIGAERQKRQATAVPTQPQVPPSADYPV